MKNKIGFVSVRNYNYGSILQAYALQQELFRYGIDNELIYYRKKNIFKQAIRIFNIPLLIAKLRDIKRKIKCRMNPKLRPIIINRNNTFGKFLEENFTFSKEIVGRSELKSYSKRYSGFLLGSDQVWNPMLLGGDYYTLTWTPDNLPIVSYASSFGVSEIPNYQKSKTKKYLSRFSLISVREKDGSNIVNDLIGNKAQVCCDPTVLIDRKVWDDLSENKAIVDEDYIFCYFIGNNPSQREFARKLAKLKKCKIVAIKHIDEYIKSDNDFGDIDLYKVGPKEFINLIRNAKFVCTDSFHGTIFSILYEKTFFTFKRFSDKKSKSTNSRVRNILSLLCLDNRLFENDSDPKECINIEINWNEVYRRLSEFRNDSRKYFEKAIEYLR